MEPFVPPPYPYDRLAGVIATARNTKVEPSTCRSVIRVIRRPQPSSRRWATAAPSAATVLDRVGCIAMPPRWMSASRRRRRRSNLPAASAPRSSSRPAPSVAAPSAGSRHRAVSPVSYPSYRWGRPRRLPGVPVPVDEHWRLDRRHRSRRRRPSVVPLGEHPVTPPVARRPRRRRCVGSCPRRAGLQRRVLRRVHVGGAGRFSRRASTGSSLCTRCRSGRTSRAPESASTPATPSSSATSPRSANISA